jgi:DNA-3-methyladenine glycosylase I
MREAITHPDGLLRCPWAGTDALYVHYHDTDWGVPEWDDRALFEKLILDGFQAGLSWITILRKREAFRAAFANFEPEILARWGDEELHTLMQNTGIVRNRAKILGTFAGARAYLALQEKQGFSNFLWQHMEGKPQQNAWRFMEEVPTQTETSQKLSRALKQAGFTFCGPTIIYAFMQAVGMVNDHLVSCFRHKECAAYAVEDFKNKGT